MQDEEDLMRNEHSLSDTCALHPLARSQASLERAQSPIDLQALQQASKCPDS